MKDGRKVVYVVLALGILAGIAYAMYRKEEKIGVEISNISVKVV